ncbi:MAG: T9SS type A sorting domain-containing protein [Bacteroidota bacterium]
MKKCKVIILVVYFGCYSIAFSFGQSTFQKTYSTGQSCWGMQARKTLDSGVVMAGYSHHSGGPDDIYTVKTDANGDTIWTRSYGSLSGRCYAIDQTSDSGFILTGYLNDLSFGAYVTYLLKIKVNGDIDWIKGYYIYYNAIGYSVEQTIDGGYLLAGEFDTTGGLGRAFIIKTDDHGNISWNKEFSCGQSNHHNRAFQSSDGNYVLSGTHDLGIFVIKLDTSSTVLWGKIYATGSINPTLFDVRETFNGGYIVFGNSILTKTDSIGNSVWVKTYDTSLRSPEMTLDSGFIFIGPAMGLVNTDSTGNINWAKYYNYSAPYPEITSVFQSGGDFFLFGSIFPFVNTGEYILTKTDPVGGNCNENNMSVNVTSSTIQVTNASVVQQAQAIVVTFPILTESRFSYIYNECSSVAVPKIETTLLNINSISIARSLELHFSITHSANLLITLYDIIGRVLFQQQVIATPGINSKEIEVGELVQGVYVVAITGSGDHASTKVVKE